MLAQSPMFSSNRSRCIHHICYRRHRQCLCKLFLPGVNYSRLNTKNLLCDIAVQQCVQHCLSVILQNVCEFTQCTILYTVCYIHYTVCNFTQSVFFCTQAVMLYSLCNLYRMCCFYTQYVVLRSVYSFAVQFYTQMCIWPSRA